MESIGGNKKGKVSSSSMLTAIRKNRAIANSYSQNSIKTRGSTNVTDIVQFKSDLNTFNSITSGGELQPNNTTTILAGNTYTNPNGSTYTVEEGTTLIVYGLFDNYGIFINNGTVIVYGTFHSYVGGSFTNNSLFISYGFETTIIDGAGENNGNIEIYGRFDVAATSNIANNGTMEIKNSGVMTVEPGGNVVNNGAIINTQGGTVYADQGGVTGNPVDGDQPQPVPAPTTSTTTMPPPTTSSTTMPPPTTSSTTMPLPTTSSTTIPDETTSSTTIPDETTSSTTNDETTSSTTNDETTTSTTIPDETTTSTTNPLTPFDLSEIATQDPTNTWTLNTDTAKVIPPGYILTIESTEIFIIPDGGNLNVQQSELLNEGTLSIDSGGTLTNNGTITNTYEMTNNGTLINREDGTLINNDTLTNNATFNLIEGSTVINNGLINNNFGGTGINIADGCALDNTGDIDNNFLIFNFGTFSNIGTITNSGQGVVVSDKAIPGTNYAVPLDLNTIADPSPSNPGLWTLRTDSPQSVAGSTAIFVQSGQQLDIPDNGILIVEGYIFNLALITHNGTISVVGSIYNSGTIDNTVGIIYTGSEPSCTEGNVYGTVPTGGVLNECYTLPLNFYSANVETFTGGVASRVIANNTDNFVAVGSGPQPIWYSTDNQGTSWTAATLMTMATFTGSDAASDLGYPAANMVAVGSGDGPIMYSTDGLGAEWNLAELTGGNNGFAGSSVATDKVGNWVVVGGGTSSSNIWYATDASGSTWETATSASGTPFYNGHGYAVASDDIGCFVAVGGDESSNPIWYSTDNQGTSWTAATFTAGNDGEEYYSVATDKNGTWVAVGYGTNNIVWSEDGSVWNSVSGATFGSAYGNSVGFYGSNGWVAVGSPDQNATTGILYSLNASEWYETTGGAFSGAGYGISVAQRYDGTLVAVGSDVSSIWYSRNTSNWVPVTNSPNGTTFGGASIASSGVEFVAVGTGATSADNIWGSVQPTTTTTTQDPNMSLSEIADEDPNVPGIWTLKSGDQTIPEGRILTLDNESLSCGSGSSLNIDGQLLLTNNSIMDSETVIINHDTFTIELGCTFINYYGGPPTTDGTIYNSGTINIVGTLNNYSGTINNGGSSCPAGSINGTITGTPATDACPP